MFYENAFNIDSNYPSDWSSRSNQVYRRDNHTCQNCGEGGDHSNIELHAHHVVPISKGGSHKESNLKTLCKTCHNAIHHREKMARTHESHQKKARKNKSQLGERPLTFKQIYERWGEVPGFPDYDPEDSSTHPSREEAPDIHGNLDLAADSPTSNQLVIIWAVFSFLLGYSAGGFLSGFTFMTVGIVILGVANHFKNTSRKLK